MKSFNESDYVAYLPHLARSQLHLSASAKKSHHHHDWLQPPSSSSNSTSSTQCNSASSRAEREATFVNYPLECALLATTLLELGFCYDSSRRCVVCSHCSYVYTNLVDGNTTTSNSNAGQLAATASLDDLLSAHLRHRQVVSSSSITPPDSSDSDNDGEGGEEEDRDAEVASRRQRRPCPLAEAALIATLRQMLDDNDTTDTLSNHHGLVEEADNCWPAPSASALFFTSEENRLKSFENERLVLDARLLAANGLYRVRQEDTFAPATAAALRLASAKQQQQQQKQQQQHPLKHDRSHIEQIAGSLGALVHVRCAYCPYECLLFRNSVLNTLYKSPFDEHRHKSADKCPMIGVGEVEELAATADSVQLTSLASKYEAKLAWMQTLYDMESSGVTHATDTLLNASDYSTLDNIVVQRMPKILEHLRARAYMGIASTKSGSALERDAALRQANRTGTGTGTTTTTTTAIYYVPRSASTSQVSSLSTTQTTTAASDAASPLTPVSTLIAEADRLSLSLSSTSTSSSSASAAAAASAAAGATTPAVSISSDFQKIQEVVSLSDGTISERAYHPNYATYAARLATFETWPATIGASQQPAQLARAGFYFFGIKDMVKCFFCNGGLKNWDANDDPFEDHVRWFPRCQFIRQFMGPDYVEHIRDKYKHLDSGFTAGAGSTTTGGASSSSSTRHDSPAASTATATDNNNNNSSSSGKSARAKRSVSPRAINARMDTNLVRRIIDAGVVTRDSLKQALEARLNAQPPDNDFATSLELVQAAYDLDKRRMDRGDALRSLGHVLIANLPDALGVDTVRQFVRIKYAVQPSGIKLVREQGATNRMFCLLTFRKEDVARAADEIYRDLHGKPFPINLDEKSVEANATELIVVKTDWAEIDEKIKPALELFAQESIAHSMTAPLLSDSAAARSTRGTGISLSASASRASTFDAPPMMPRSHKNSSSAAATHRQASPAAAAAATGSVPPPALPQRQLDDMSNENALLKEENERLKNERLCVICLDKPKNITFLPCAHLVACFDCSLPMQSCPMCRTVIQATVRNFT